MSAFKNVKTMFGVEELNTYFGHLWNTPHVPAVLGVPYGLFGLLGVTILGEQPGAGSIAGLLLILAGSWLSTDGRLPRWLTALSGKPSQQARRSESS